MWSIYNFECNYMFVCCLLIARCFYRVIVIHKTGTDNKIFFRQNASFSKISWLQSAADRLNVCVCVCAFIYVCVQTKHIKIHGLSQSCLRRIDSAFV